MIFNVRTSIGILDLSSCTSLNYLECSNNNITSLNLSRLAVKLFRIWGNPLDSLNLMNCNSLQYLTIWNDSLSYLNLDGCSSINSLDVSRNNLDSLDLSSCTALQYVYFGISDVF